ncbi:hypothetical protein EI94DRAFT_1705878 [Lactarius quietus]|nr:hypothetical protein EI94DRAFT_1705878 [Lactarius quietus]
MARPGLPPPPLPLLVGPSPSLLEFFAWFADARSVAKERNDVARLQIELDWWLLERRARRVAPEPDPASACALAMDWAGWGDEAIGGKGERNHPRGHKQKQVTGDPLVRRVGKCNRRRYNAQQAFMWWVSREASDDSEGASKMRERAMTGAVQDPPPIHYNLTNEQEMQHKKLGQMAGNANLHTRLQRKCYGAFQF